MTDQRLPVLNRGPTPVYALRISVIDACQLRCAYCAPLSIEAFKKYDELLQPEHYRRLAAALRQHAVQKIRITGGEPTLRQDLPDIVAALVDSLDNVDCALTTNGLLLGPMLPALSRAGLHRINMHLDTLRPERYPSLMGKGSPVAVTDAISTAKNLGLSVKVNAVIQRHKNDDELDDFLALSRELGVEVRFIEQMDTGSAPAHVQATFLSGEEILERVGGSVQQLSRVQSSDPAEQFATEDGTVFGLIASDTRPFCSACDRLRLTATGRLRGCLYQPGGIDVGSPLKRGASDDEVAALLARGFSEKASWHPDVRPDRPAFSMAQIGG